MDKLDSRGALRKGGKAMSRRHGKMNKLAVHMHGHMDDTTASTAATTTTTTANMDTTTGHG
jgi:hypothetical protein